MRPHGAARTAPAAALPGGGKHLPPPTLTPGRSPRAPGAPPERSSRRSQESETRNLAAFECSPAGAGERGNPRIPLNEARSPGH